MVKIERTSTPPPSLASEKVKANGNYRESDVMRQLAEDFHKKCYLCEIDELQSVEVEHLYPHGGDKNLKFDWGNLFLSCAHCNSVKNQGKYHGVILDCCKVDPESVLNQQFLNDHVSVQPTADMKAAVMTAELLTECFERKNTGIRIMECQTRINALRKTMNLLYKTLKQYRNSPSGRTLHTLRGMLSRTYKFAGFTRAYVRNHLETYPELAEYVRL